MPRSLLVDGPAHPGYMDFKVQPLKVFIKEKRERKQRAREEET